jgi:iron complex transport system substrate-binding protein
LFNFRNIRDSFSLATIYWVFTVLVAVALVTSGVNGSIKKSDESNTNVAQFSTTFPMTVTDDLGRTITIDKAPQRIVSLAPSNTEILFDLGLGDKVVGDTTYDDYPAAALDKPHVGGYSDIDIEKVVSLAPDLILAEDIDKADIIPALEKLGFKVYALVPHNLDEIEASVSTIGRLTGANAAAKTIVSQMQSNIKVITDKTSKLTAAQNPRVLYVIWQDPIMSSGSDTPIWDMIDKAGGTNVCPDETGYPTISMESVIADNPQVVICNVDNSYAGGNAPLVFFQTEPRLKGIAASVSGKVYGIDASLTNRPVPRIIQGFEWMAAMIHPELFPQFVTQYMATTTTAVTSTAAK